MNHNCEYVPGVLVEGGQLYYCWHCSAEQFVPDPWVSTPQVESKEPRQGDDYIPF